MNEDGFCITIVALSLILSISSFISGYRRGYVASTNDMRQRLEEVDSVKSIKPQPVKESNIGYAAVPVKDLKDAEPHVKSRSSKGSSLRDAFTDSIPEDSIVIGHMHSDGDSSKLYALIPMKQKEYRDSDYTAFISGYGVSLDSLIIRRKAITLTQTKYRRWNIGITAGYGYGLKSKKVEPFVGVGITLNIFK